MSDLFNRSVEEIIGYIEQKSMVNSQEGRICREILNDNILVCIYCCGFVGKGCDECPHCGESLGLFNNKTQAISIKDYSKDKLVNDCINGGIYVGRYSDSKEVSIGT